MENNLLDDNLTVNNPKGSFDERVKSRIEDGYEFKFGEYISDGFRIFGQNAGGFIGFAFIYLALAVLASLLPSILSNIASLLLNPLVAGFILVSKKIYKGEQHSFNDFFALKQYYGVLLGTSVISSLLTILGIILLILPGIYLSVAFSFATCFVVLGGQKIESSLKLSQKVVHKQWWSFLGFLLVLGLINVVGLIALGVGVLVTLPASLAAMYVAYEDIIGTD